jgi:hypothetical protein
MDMCRLWVWRGLVGVRTRGLLLYRRSSPNTPRYPHLGLPALLSVYPVLGNAFTNDLAVAELWICAGCGCGEAWLVSECCTAVPVIFAEHFPLATLCADRSVVCVPSPQKCIYK